MYKQGAIGRQEFELAKIGGEHNSSDVVGKPVSQGTMKRHMETFGCRVVPTDTPQSGDIRGVWTRKHSLVDSTALAASLEARAVPPPWLKCAMLVHSSKKH